jgi:hypothetical protein
MKKLPEDADPADKRVIENIKKFGWHITGIPAEENYPPHTFSVGLYEKFNHPEIIIVGLDINLAASLINNIGEQVKSGKKFEPGKSYNKLLAGDFKSFFIKVDKKNYKEYVGIAGWYYGSPDFPLLQFVWPTKDGLFPWDKNSPKEFLEDQPLLGKK